MVGNVAGVLVLAALIEALVEYLLGLWWKPWNPESRKKVLSALTLAAGIVVSLWAQLDLLKLVGINIPVLGNILTGTIIGRGSDALHQFINKYLPKP